MSTEYKKLKKKVLKNFSKYIRLRDCLNTTGTLGMGRCCTCGNVFPFIKLQAGHFLPGRRNSVLFDERNCHAQCIGCNTFGRGKPIEYREFMKEKYGEKVIEELEQKAKQTVKFTITDLKYMNYNIVNKIKDLTKQSTIYHY